MTPLETELTAHLKVALSELAYWHAGWRATPVMLYDEGGVEGWMWISPQGAEHYEIGAHDEPPPLPQTRPAAPPKAHQFAKFLDALIHLKS